MRSQVQKGFTLIELMIVVAIVAILAAIALPQYQNFTVRAQVTDGLSLASGVETKIVDYYNSQGSWPTDGSTLGGLAAGTDISGKYVSKVVVAGGGITITFGNSAATALSGKTLGLTPGTNGNGDISWICGTATAPTGVTAVSGASATTSTGMTTYYPKNCQ